MPQAASGRTGRIRIKRIYEKTDDVDGMRVLIDRIWPRGVAKETAGIALWMKEVAPSPSLRTWFGHVPERFADFSARYEAELREPEVQSYLERLLGFSRSEPNGVTLLYAAKDTEHNHAVVLQRFLERMKL